MIHKKCKECVHTCKQEKDARIMWCRKFISKEENQKKGK